MLVLALPFRHYIECLVIPFCVLVVELVYLLFPRQDQINARDRLASNCSSLSAVFETRGLESTVVSIYILLIIAFYVVIP